MAISSPPDLRDAVEGEVPARKGRRLPAVLDDDRRVVLLHDRRALKWLVQAAERTVVDAALDRVRALRDDQRGGPLAQPLPAARVGVAGGGRRPFEAPEAGEPDVDELDLRLALVRVAVL